MYIKGTVTQIVYYNQENGYSVVVVESDGKEVTCVGNMPIISEGELLELEGNLTVHPKYGEQLAVKNFSVTAPRSKDGVIKYLASGLIRGIGEATAKKIYDEFGDKSMDIIETNPTALSKVKGISANKALDIGNSYMEIKKMQTQIMFLQSYNISINLAIRIYNVYKDGTRDIVKTNPYQLIDDVDGVGFTTADKIARNLGVTEDSPFRMRAATVHVLKEGATSGNTYLRYDIMKNEAANVLRLDLNEYEGTYDEVVSRLELDTVIKIFQKDDNKCVALTRYFNMERFIASTLVKLKREATPIALDFKTLVDEFERVNKIKFHKNQAEAVESAIKNGVTVITGGPGTGKTTIVKCIAHIFGTQGLKMEFCAPTGRAAKRLSQSIGAEAKTIHRMLGVNYASGQLSFTYNQNNPLNADVIVVDELSMVDVTIMNSLLRAVRCGSRLVLVGDKDQLPSVGAGNVLADIIKSDIIEIKYLTYIYRQSEDSLIITNAHKINECKMPVLSNSANTDFFIEKNEQYPIEQIVVDLVARRLPQFSHVSSADIQVLAPMRVRNGGVDNLNLLLQDKLNPPSKDKKQINLGNIVFRVGDKVMQTVNDYQLQWTRFTDYGAIETGEGVFNGDIGFVTAIDPSSGFVEVAFDDNRTAQYTQIDLYNLTLAYAVTIHKSQGCEFDVVVVPLVGGPKTLLNKNLLYTAVTRAKKMVVLVCSPKILSMAVHCNYIAERTTLLNGFLMEEDDKYKQLYLEDI